jgi:hypothetical protein
VEQKLQQSKVIVRLVDIGVLEEDYSSKWSSMFPTFAIPKNKVKFEWHSSHQQAFDKIKKVIGTEMQILLCYQDLKKPVLFHLYIDLSDHQLGAVKKWYTTTERDIEMFSAI